MVEKKTVYDEAMRYIKNAKETLKKAGKKDGEYGDIKYVQSASGAAYVGILLALDEFLKRRERNFEKPKSIEDYQCRVTKQDKKVLKWLNLVYVNLHLAGYYHGTTSYDSIQTGLQNGQKIINLIKS